MDRPWTIDLWDAIDAYAALDKGSLEERVKACAAVEAVVHKVERGEYGAAPTAQYPKDLTPELRAVLGMMVFQLSPVAHLFRDHGAEIPRRAEDEQAFVLHWLIGLALEHGAQWSEIAGHKVDELQRKSAP